MARLTKRLSLWQLSGAIALVGLATWGIGTLAPFVGISLDIPLWLAQHQPPPPVWWFLVWALLPRLGARLMSDIQLTPSEYRGLIASGLWALLLYPTIGNDLSALASTLLPGAVGIGILVLSAGNSLSPTRYLLLGVGIGLGALWEPWALTLVLLLFLSMGLLGSLTMRHIVATLMGIVTIPLVAIPIVGYYLHDASALGELARGWLEGWSISLGEPGYLSPVYLLILALEIMALLTTMGVRPESIRERRQSTTLLLWSAGLLLLSLLTGGAESTFTLLGLLPLSLSVARGLDHFSGRSHTIALGVVAVLIALCTLIPSFTNPTASL